MSSLKVVVVDSTYLGGPAFFELEKEVINELGGELILTDFKSEREIIEGTKEADIVLCCGNPPITRDVLKAIPGDLVIRYGIGVNSIDLKGATDNRKIIYNSPGFCKEELVTHASALILACLRNLCYYNSEIRAGNWPKGKGPAPRRLSKLTVGIFGFGDSARPMARVFREGFNSRVMAYDPYMDRQAADEYDVIPVDFDTLLRESDIITIHAPLTDSTYHIFNKDAFKKMKDTSMIINVSRGGIICEEDLIEALENNEIAYAGLDVFEKEPIEEDNPLLKMPNVILTPHSAYYGLDALKNTHTIISGLLRNYKNNRIVKRNIANPDVIPFLTDYQLIEKL